MMEQISAIVRRYLCEGMTWVPIATTPKPLFVIGWGGSWSDDDFDSAMMFLIRDLAGAVVGSKTCSCVRCVGLDRLGVALSTGCDVEPTDAVLWVDKSSGKSLEYGGDTKVMLIFDMRKTKASYEEVAADLGKEQLETLRKTYPTVLPSIDGKRIWLSRLPEQDRRVASAYEIEHARWIPDDPFDALVGILVIGRNPVELERVVRQQCESCKTKQWQ